MQPSAPHAMFRLRNALCVILSLFVVQTVSAEDVVEFLNGSKLTGKILEIRKPDREFDFECMIGGQQVKQTIPYSKVHAVSLSGKRFVLTPMDSAGESESGTSSAAKSPDEVQQVIATLGASDPDWLASTQLNHPKSLDLAWPMKAEGPWNESKNVGQYIWGRVNPNVARWKSGIKLLYECMDRHQQDRTLLVRDMEKLGVMYFELLQDYPRAAYWLQKAKVRPDKKSGVYLAECYYRLGSKSMAMRVLNARQLNVGAIKLLGELGEIDKALLITRAYESSGLFNEAWLNAGDALRSAGRLEEAIEYYQKVLDRDQARNKEYLQRYRGRASESIELIRLFDRADVSRVADGSYRASATGYNGPLEVEVTVKDAKITDVRVVKHKEKQFYAALTDTPKQIIDTQGFSDIDGTSGATITSQAVVNATARALNQGVK